MKQTMYRHNNSVFGCFEEGKGGISYIDTIQPVKNIDECFDIYPFKIKYKITDNGRLCGYGSEYDFLCGQNENINDEISKIYYSKDKRLKVTVRYELVESCNTIRTYCEVENLKKENVVIELLTSSHISGIFGGGQADNEDLKDLKIYTLKNTWAGEGRLETDDINSLNLSKIYTHSSRAKYSITATGSQTTKKNFPVIMIENQKQNKMWYFQYEPASAWDVSLSLKDCEGKEGAFLCVETKTSDAASGEWNVIIKQGETYKTPYTAFGVINGSLNEAVRELTVYRRKYLKKTDYNMSLVFNDFMNCHWANPNYQRTSKLIEAAAKAGAEIFCLDSGWYKNNNDDWFGKLGDWLPSEDLFLPYSLQGIIDKILSLNLKCGLWLEIECCTETAKAATFPDSWFLTRNGARIFESGRYFFDFSNTDTTDYLKECIRKLYNMGVRFFKNDYNASIGYGCDYNGICSLYGFERQSYHIKDFFNSLYLEFDGIIIENCGSGAMREDYFILSSFDFQSITDCEDYRNYPPIINGTLINILPEHCGVWCMPYPQSYQEKDNENFDTKEYISSMSDGEQTIFNIVNGFMGLMYLSGRIDKADDFNFSLFKQGIMLYKQYREKIKNSFAVFPLPCGNIAQTGFSAQGLKYDNKILLAVFRRGAGNSIAKLEINGIENAEIIYPYQNFKEDVKFDFTQSNINISFTKPYQARLFLITLKK